MAKKNASTKMLPYTVRVTVSQEICDRDEPNRIDTLYRSYTGDAGKFRKAVREAVMDWISDDPEGFAESERWNGHDLLCSKPGDPGFLEEAAESVTWKMVVCDLPDEIALRHGFETASILDADLEVDEDDDI